MKNRRRLLILIIIIILPGVIASLVVSDMSSSSSYSNNSRFAQGAIGLAWIAWYVAGVLVLGVVYIFLHRLNQWLNG